jgi:CubicO group peptidase (beta-lactamase class C family)
MRHKIILAASVSLVGLLSGVAAQLRAGQAPPVPALAGLWGSESVLGPQVRGALTLERQGGRWIARIGGYELDAPVAGDEVRFELSDGAGGLRARLEDQGRWVRGFWIQHGEMLGPYATPVTLARVRADAWRGTVRPLAERFSLYLMIRRDEQGELHGAFHNPQANWRGGATSFRIVPEDGKLTLVDPATGKVRFVQPFDPDRRAITMDFGRPMLLRPTSLASAVGFVPRTPRQLPWTYREPLPEDDGWATAPAHRVGLDERVLSSGVDSILAIDAALDTGPRIHSLLVARHGKLVLEEYFYGATAGTPHDLRSASKSFTSLMAGIAMEHGAGFTMESPVLPFFTAAEGAADSGDPRKARITIGQLLTHTSGLACDDNDDSSPGNEDTMQHRSEDWYDYTLRLPMSHDPGTTYSYCSGGVNLVGGVIAKTTGTWLPEFFDRYVARPLGIDRYGINLMPSGEGYAAGGMHLRSRDFLKIGQAMLDGGVWNGRRLVSKRWVEVSTARQVDVPGGASDGYGWHRHRLAAAGRTYDEYEASGNGGQFLIVVPQLDLVVVITAGNYGQYGIWRTFRDEFVPRYVLAAAE